MTTTKLIAASTLLVLALVAGCGDEVVEIAPVCDDIGWPLEIGPIADLPAPEYAVECAEGWGNAATTRPGLTTTALPGDAWTGKPHPAGGWVLVAFLDDPGWASWLEQHGVELETVPAAYAMVWVKDDGELGWVVPMYAVWMIDIVGEQLWALGWDEANELWLLAFDALTADLIDARAWDFPASYNLLAAARDPAGGAWISAIEGREQDDQVDQLLYRAHSLDTIELVATRTTADPRQAPSGNLEPLVDGGVAWAPTVEGFELLEPDGSVRWARDEGGGAHASDADSLLIVSLVSTGVGAGRALRLEKAGVADGASVWVHEHQRYIVSEPDECGPQGCPLLDIAFPTLRPDGGYLLAGGHAYPSGACSWQPLLMAVSSSGEAEWTHRIETCGRAYWIGMRDDSTFDLLGFAWDTSGSIWADSWVRSFEL